MCTMANAASNTDDVEVKLGASIETSDSLSLFSHESANRCMEHKNFHFDHINQQSQILMKFIIYSCIYLLLSVLKIPQKIDRRKIANIDQDLKCFHHNSHADESSFRRFGKFQYVSSLLFMQFRCVLCTSSASLLLMNLGNLFTEFQIWKCGKFCVLCTISISIAHTAASLF